MIAVDSSGSAAGYSPPVYYQVRRRPAHCTVTRVAVPPPAGRPTGEVAGLIHGRGAASPPCNNSGQVVVPVSLTVQYKLVVPAGGAVRLGR